LRAIDLAGLPPGAYRLELDIAYSDTTVVRDGEFEVADPFFLDEQGFLF